MEQQSLSQYRFAPLALGLVLITVLALLALRAHAEENATPVRTEVRQAMEERRALFEENQAERAAWRAAETNEDMRNAFEARRAELANNVAERRAEWEENAIERHARLSEEVQNRLGAFAGRTAERLYAALDRLVAVADKIGARITKVEEAHGVDLSEARAELDEAYDVLGGARGDVANFEQVVADALASDAPRADMERVREAFSLARDGIREAHRALRDVVMRIRAAIPAPKTGETPDTPDTPPDDSEG